MAQLRHPETSDLLAVGQPRDLIIIADGLSFDPLWDDVGNVDLDALRAANRDRTEALEGAARDEEVARQAAVNDVCPAVAAAAEQAEGPALAPPDPVDVTAEVDG